MNANTDDHADEDLKPEALMNQNPQLSSQTNEGAVNEHGSRSITLRATALGGGLMAQEPSGFR